MMRLEITCANCGRTLQLGDDSYTSALTDEDVFCSTKCMKESLIDNHLDDVVDRWIDDNSVWGEIEEENPYGRYGVSRGDF